MSPPPNRLLVRKEAAALFAALLAANAGAWIWALAAFRAYPLLMGPALLAYTLGLRHAVDADHIAAIDNVTRRLMRRGQRPISVGLYFSLGHSSVVFALCLVVAAAAVSLNGRLAAWAGLAGTLGTCVSAAFLLGIAAANALVLRSTYRTFVTVRRGGTCPEDDLDLVLGRRGWLGRAIRALFGLVGRSSQMYLVGLVFGLGFDTATEVGVLGLSAKGGATGLPAWSILVFPALFTAGMALVDTADGVVMLGAYQWAFVQPLRRLRYNLTITLISVLVASFVGGVELLGLAAERWKLQGPAWRALAAMNDHFGLMGLAVIGIFLATWAASLVFCRLGEKPGGSAPQVMETGGSRPGWADVPEKSG